MKSETYNVDFALPNHIQAALELGMIDADDAFTTGITDIMLHPRNYDFYPDPGNRLLVPYFIKMLKASSNYGVNLPQILPDIIRNVVAHSDELDMRHAYTGRESQYYPDGGNSGLAGSIEPITLAPLERTSLLFHFLKGTLNRKTHENPKLFERQILAPSQEEWFKARHEAYQNIKREV